jgi:hypothetical protein
VQEKEAKDHAAALMAPRVPEIVRRFSQLSESGSLPKLATLSPSADLLTPSSTSPTSSSPADFSRFSWLMPTPDSNATEPQPEKRLKKFSLVMNRNGGGLGAKGYMTDPTFDRPGRNGSLPALLSTGPARGGNAAPKRVSLSSAYSGSSVSLNTSGVDMNVSLQSIMNREQMARDYQFTSKRKGVSTALMKPVTSTSKVATVNPH